MEILIAIVVILAIAVALAAIFAPVTIDFVNETESAALRAGCSWHHHHYWYWSWPSPWWRNRPRLVRMVHFWECSSEICPRCRDVADRPNRCERPRHSQH